MFVLAACFLAPFSASAEGYSEDYGGTGAVFGKSDGTAVLYTGNENARTDPGSLAEIMTLLLASRALTSERVTRTEYTTVSESAVALAPGKATEKAGLKVGEKIKLYDLMYVLAVSGANDAAYVLAEALEGTAEDFVGLMNDTAESLGATNTTFTAPCETSDGSAVSTARDLYLILSEASSDGNFMALMSTREYSVKRTNLSPQRDFTSKVPFRNIRSDYYIEGTLVGFASTFDEHAYKAAVLVKRKGFSAIAIVLGDKNAEDGKPQNFSVFDGVRGLADWHFLNYEVKVVLTSAQVVGTPPVKFGSGKKEISVFSREDIEYLLPAGIQLSEITVSVIYDFPQDEESFVAPLTNGQVVGKILFIYEGELLGQTEAIIRESVAIDSLALFLTELRFWVVRNETLYLVALIVATLILYAACTIRYLIKKHRIVVFRTAAAKKIPPHKIPPDLAELMSNAAPEPEARDAAEVAAPEPLLPEVAEDTGKTADISDTAAEDAVLAAQDAGAEQEAEEFAPGWSEEALPGIAEPEEKAQTPEKPHKLRQLAASAKSAAAETLQKAGVAAKKAGAATSRAARKAGVVIKNAAFSAADGLRFAAGKVAAKVRDILKKK